MTEDTPLRFDGPAAARWTLVLAHGAGQGMDSPFMTYFAETLGCDDIRVVRFDFPYMRASAQGGRRRPPNGQKVLLETWRSIIRQLRQDHVCGRLAIGGKSMGGRMASLIAAEQGVDALVCLGYPFHPPGKPDRLRTEHLYDLVLPTLICQGERDTFGSRGEVEGYGLPSAVRLHWVADGDHSFKPRKSSGFAERDNWLAAAQAIRRFLAQL